MLCNRRGLYPTNHQHTAKSNNRTKILLQRVPVTLVQCIGVRFLLSSAINAGRKGFCRFVCSKKRVKWFSTD